MPCITSSLIKHLLDVATESKNHFSKSIHKPMKNSIIISLFLVCCSFGVLRAQPYALSVTPLNGSTTQFSCRVLQTGSSTWSNGDLITWIFPDGQMQQKEIIKNGNTALNYEVTWAPYNTNVNVNTVQAYIAKKGDTGDPAKAVVPGNPTPVFSGGSSTTPININFPVGRSWKASYTWEFARGKHNFLVLSYKKEFCDFPTAQFDIVLPPGVEMVDTLSFKSEYMSVDEDTIILGVTPELNPCNFYLKLKLDTTVAIDSILNVFIRSTLCDRDDAGKPKVNPPFDTIPFQVKGEPHDPNYKEVDVTKIAKGKNSPVKLVYTIQFHNDGEAPVSNVTVIDTLPQELDPSSFNLINLPKMNGLMFNGFKSDSINPYIKKIFFKRAPNFAGLPGLNQANPKYSFDQTIYRFSFEVNTIPGIQKPIDNNAAVYFHLDDTTQLPVVITGIARVDLEENTDSTSTNQCCQDCICLCKCLCWVWGLLVILLLVALYWMYRRRRPRHKPES